jgi:hypothetical protein
LNLVFEQTVITLLHGGWRADTIDKAEIGQLINTPKAISTYAQNSSTVVKSQTRDKRSIQSICFSLLKK